MQILNSVSDIVRIKEPSAEDLYDDYEAVVKYVEKLRDDILDLEAKHKREDFVEFNEVKSRLTSFMEEVFSKGRSFKENYQTKAVSGLDSFADYNTALMAAESYIESTQERYEKALAAEAIRIEQLKAEQRIVDGLKQTAWALVDVAAIGLAIMSGGTLAPISVAILTFSAAEITEGAGNIYLGITGDGSSIAFNPIRDTLFMGNQDVYNVASLAVNIADMKLSKPKVSSLDDIARFGAKSVEAKGINRVKDLTKKLLGKVDDVGDVKKGGKGVSAADEALESGKDVSFTWKLRGKDVTLNDVKVQDISYIKRNTIELQGLRNEFNAYTRKTFLKDLGQNAEYLRSAGFSEIDILKIQNGRVPDGWQVHHKLPLDDSGTNALDNLVLIQNEPYHKVITNYQNLISRQMEIGNVQKVQWPIPSGNIYPVKH